MHHLSAYGLKERSLPFLEEDAPVRFLVPASWMEKWIRFIIGDTKPPDEPINNECFVTAGGQLRHELPPYSFVCQEQWEYLADTYGASHTITVKYVKETQT